jgi:hypothetical protein
VSLTFSAIVRDVRHRKPDGAVGLIFDSCSRIAV